MEHIKLVGKGQDLCGKVQNKRQVEVEEMIKRENASGAPPFIEEVAFSFLFPQTQAVPQTCSCFVFDAIISNVNLQLWLSNPVTVLCNMDKKLFS